MLKKSPSFVLARSKPQRTARIRLGFSLTAAALDGLFEHPASLPQTLTYRPRAKSLSRQARGGRVKWYASGSRHCRLTNSPARTNMLLLIRRSVRLTAAALGKGRVLARLGWVGELMTFLNILQCALASPVFDLDRFFTRIE